MLNQFCYDEREPNVPWVMRDQLNKCERCSKTFVGPASCVCAACANAVSLDAGVAIIYGGEK